MSATLPQNLPTLVQQKYEAAKASSSLIFSHTELTTTPVAGIPVRKPSALKPATRLLLKPLQTLTPPTVPTPLLPSTIPETGARQRQRLERDAPLTTARNESGSFREPTGRPPDRTDTGPRANPHPGAEQIPRHRTPFHTGDQAVQATDGSIGN